MSFTPNVLYDNAGNPIASIPDDDSGYALHVMAHPKGWLISDGELADHENYSGFGYDGSIPATLTDISGRSLNVPVPTTAILMEAVSSSANDAGTVVTSGTSTGGSTTTLIDTGKNFVALGVVAGDAVLNDTDVTLGVITSVDSATQLTFRPTALLSFALKAYRIVRAASTGSAVVELHGLDSNYDEISEFIVMNGITAVSSVKTHIRSNNFHSMYCGSSGVPVGNISLRDDATGTETYNYIQAGLNMSLQAHYTVPRGKNMFIPSWSAGSSGNKPIRIFLRGTADFHDRSWVPVFQVQDVITELNGDTFHRFDLPKRFPEKADVKISANVIGAGTGEVGCSFEFWIEG